MSEPINTSSNSFTRGEELLLDFLRDHDAPCPVCRYNLRGLTRPVCPECKQSLAITVGAPHIRLSWLLFALAPGFFSGIAACFLAVPTIGVYSEDGVIVLPFAGAVLFGWASGIFAIILARKRNRFITQPLSRQRWFALLIWLVHFLALLTMVFAVAPYWD